MAKLPVVSARKCIKALEKAGFFVSRQRGSHIVLKRKDPFGKVVVPNHKTIDKGTLKEILSEAGLSLEDLIDLL